MDCFYQALFVNGSCLLTSETEIFFYAGIWVGRDIKGVLICTVRRVFPLKKREIKGVSYH